MQPASLSMSMHHFIGGRYTSLCSCPPSCICSMYDNCVWYMIQSVAAALHVLYIYDSLANHSYTEHRSIAFRSLPQADGHCGQTSVHE